MGSDSSTHRHQDLSQVIKFFLRKQQSSVPSVQDSRESRNDGCGTGALFVGSSDVEKDPEIPVIIVVSKG